MTASRVALVTGVREPVGAAIVQRLARDGYAVVGCATDQSAVALCGTLQAEGHRTLGLQVATASDQAIRAAVDYTVDELGGLDVLVIGDRPEGSTPFLEISDAEWHKVTTASLTDAFMFSQMAAAAMLATRSMRTDRGRIVTVVSTGGIMPRAGSAHFGAMDAARIALSQCMAVDLGRHGITCTAVAAGELRRADRPASTEDEPVVHGGKVRFPLRRRGLPGEIAHAVAFACDPATTFMTANLLTVDGGQSAVIY